MKLSRREQLVLYLLLNEKQTITSKELAHTMNLSERTIKTTIAALKDGQAECGIEIESKSGSGYRIQITNLKLYRKTLEELSILYNYYNYVRLIKHSKGRSIIRRIILSKRPITTKTLEDDLFLSASSVYKGLMHANELLKSSHLKIENLHGKGYQVTGEELDIRLSIVEHHGIHYHKYTEFRDNELFFDIIGNKSAEIYSIRRILLDALIQHEIPIIDTFSHRLAKYLMVTIMRIKEGFLLSENITDHCALRNNHYYSFTNYILDMIAAKFQVTISVAERSAFQVLLLMSLDSTQLSFAIFSDQELVFAKTVKQHLCRYLSASFGYAIDEQQKQVLEAISVPLLFKQIYAKQIHLDLIGMFVENHPLLQRAGYLICSQLALQAIASYSSYQFTQYDKLYFAQFFDSLFLHENTVIKSMHVVVCSRFGSHSAAFMTKQIKEFFGESMFASLRTTELFRVRSMIDVSGIDFVVHDFEEYVYQYTIPHIRISRYLETQDYRLLRQHFENASLKSIMESWFDPLPLRIYREETERPQISVIGKTKQTSCIPKDLHIKDAYIDYSLHGTDQKAFVELYLLEKTRYYNSRKVKKIIRCHLPQTLNQEVALIINIICDQILNKSYFTERIGKLEQLDQNDVINCMYHNSLPE